MLRTSLRAVWRHTIPTRPYSAESLASAARTRIAELTGDELSSIDRAKGLKATETLQSWLGKLEANTRLAASLREMAAQEDDSEMRELIAADLAAAAEDRAALERHLLTALVPPKAEDALSAIVEIRAGVGGAESGLFVGDLRDMYSKWAARRGFQWRLLEAADGMVTFEVSGPGAYGALRGEAGVHRVQRVPATETQGRIHTSTVAIIVLPVAEERGDIAPLYDVKDVKVEVMRARGAGGQHVNRTESAVRLTHLPTGVTVSMQDSRSQHENRDKAFKILASRLLDRRLQEEQDARAQTRKNQVRGTDRSEKIRTYNYQRDRITDHRIPMNMTGLSDALDGGTVLDTVMERLQEKEREDELKSIIE